MNGPSSVLCITVALLFAASACAGQSTSSTKAQTQAQAQSQAPVPPPPGLDDLGVQAQPAHAASLGHLGLPPLPSLHDDGERDANGNPPPTVSVHERDGNTIQEYRMGGQLIMVRITPRHGVPYTYYVDDRGKLEVPPGAPPVKPVYYTLFKWGAPPAPVDDGSDSD